jgi:tRNA(Ile)-lysidine synthase TilS/MesJ
MIADGDSVAVGISGGKDSLVLLKTLAALRNFLPEQFKLYAITIDMGFPNTNFSEIGAFCESLNVPYSIVKTQIAEIVFDVRREPNPCSLCAKMRRGALHDEAKRLGCNKLALGHHNNDVVDTFMLNLIYGGRFSTFQPVTYLSRKDITVIRPFIYAQEYEIASYAKKAGIPVMKSPCTADGGTERTEIKKLLSELGHRYLGIRQSIFRAIERAQIDGYHENRRGKRRPERTYVDEPDD